MAQVIKKLLSGGPIVLTRGSKKFSYADLEDKIWSNYNKYVEYKGWDPKTASNTRNYLSLYMDGLKNGSITPNPDGSLNVPTGDLETDGIYNESGHGIFRHSITNDEKAFKINAVNLINEAINSLGNYTEPTKKRGITTTDIAKSIVDNDYRGSTDAFKEAWTTLTPEDRRKKLGEALSRLDFGEYEDSENLLKSIQDLLAAIDNPEITIDQLSAKWNLLGGSGLKNFLNGTPDEDSESAKEETTEAKTEDQLREDFRKEAINNGVLADLIDAYVELKLKKHRKNNNYTELLEKSNELDLLQLDVDDFGNWLDKQVKETLGQNLNTLKVVKGDAYKPIDFRTNGYTQDQITTMSKLAYNLIRNNREKLKTDPDASHKLISLADFYYNNGIGKLSEDGRYMIMPHSYDNKTKTVIAFIPEDNAFRIMSIYLFFQYYQKEILNDYNRTFRKNISPQDLASMLGTPTTPSTDTSVSSNKEGGVLKLKAGDGIKFLQQLLSNTSSQTSELDFWKNWDEQIKSSKQQLELEAKDAGYSNVQDYQNAVSKETKKLKEINEAVKHGQLEASLSNLKDYDIANIAGAMFDVIETVGSLTGGAVNPVTWGSGLGSLGAYTYADIKDPRVSKWGVVSGLGMNLLLSAAGLVPEVGAAAPMVRFGKLALRYGPVLYALFSDTPRACAAIGKIIDGKKVTTDDWIAIADGIRAISTGTRGAKGLYSDLKYTIKDKVGNAKVKSNEGWKEVNEATFNKINGKKKADLASETELKDVNGNPLGEIEFGSRFAGIGEGAARVLKPGTQYRPMTLEEHIQQYGDPTTSFLNWSRATNIRLNIKTPKISFFEGKTMTPQQFRLRMAGTVRNGVLKPLAPFTRTNTNRMLRNPNAKVYISNEGKASVITPDPSTFAALKQQGKAYNLEDLVIINGTKRTFKELFESGQTVILNKKGGILKYQNSGTIVPTTEDWFKKRSEYYGTSPLGHLELNTPTILNESQREFNANLIKSKYPFLREKAIDQLAQDIDSTENTIAKIQQNSDTGKANPGNEIESKATKIGKYARNVIDNVDRGDLLSLVNYFKTQASNKKQYREVLDSLLPVLLTPTTQTAVLHGAYPILESAQDANGKLAAYLGQTTRNSSDARKNRASSMEIAKLISDNDLKAANEYLASLQNSYKEINETENKNFANLVATANENLTREQANEEAKAKIRSDFEKLKNDNRQALYNRFINAFDTAKVQWLAATKEAKKTALENIYSRKLDMLQDELRTLKAAYDLTKPAQVSEFYASNEYKDWKKKVADLDRELKEAFANLNVNFYNYTPFFNASLTTEEKKENPFETVTVSKSKKGGTLSYSERMALKLEHEFEENRRAAAKIASRERIETKRADSKARNLVSLHVADLILIALGKK